MTRAKARIAAQKAATAHQEQDNRGPANRGKIRGGTTERALSKDQLAILHRAIGVCIGRPDEAEPLVRGYDRADWVRQILEIHDAIDEHHAEASKNLPPRSHRDAAATYPVRLSPALWDVVGTATTIGLGHIREISTSWSYSFAARTLLELGQIARRSAKKPPPARGDAE